MTGFEIIGIIGIIILGVGLAGLGLDSMGKLNKRTPEKH